MVVVVVDGGGRGSIKQLCSPTSQHSPGKEEIEHWTTKVPAVLARVKTPATCPVLIKHRLKTEHINLDQSNRIH